MKNFLKKSKDTKKIRLVNAFTLSEVLIVIVVLGVVAALTIPVLQNKKNRNEWITGLNKSYTVLSNGFKNSEALYGKVTSWDTNFLTYLKDAFKVQEECFNNDCVADVKYLNNESFSLPENTTSYILPDNQLLSVELLDTTCSQDIGGLKNICGKIYVDINNKKGPNTWGKDYFGFYITQKGIIPFGNSKIDVYKPDFGYVTNGCHGQGAQCKTADSFSCANAQTDKNVCEICNGQWSFIYHPETYKVESYAPVYKLTKDAYVSQECNGYQLCQSCWTVQGWCYSYGGYHCSYSTLCSYYTCCSNYVPVYHPAEYAVDYYTPNTYTVNTAAYKEYYCSGNVQDKVCTWNCWYQYGIPYEDICNDNGTANETSCPIKDVKALEDCNLDDKGTSCTAWTLYEGNMIYLDAKDIDW